MNVEQSTLATVPAESIPVASSSALIAKESAQEVENSALPRVEYTDSSPAAPVLPFIEPSPVSETEAQPMELPFIPILEEFDNSTLQATDSLEQVPHITIPDTSNFSDSGQESLHPSSAHPPTSSESSPSSQHNASNQFPPSGTLVVVQGVVHTTDAPRPSAAIQQSEASRLAANSSLPSGSLAPGESQSRNRLSSLLRPRPGSTATSRPSSFAEPPTTQPQTDVLGAIEALSDTMPGDDQRAQTAPLDAGTESPSTNPPTNISQSSVEVLGTLLSVAAAATAASLLTGNSEPIFPSQNTSSSSATSNSPPATPSSPSDPAPPTNAESWATRPNSPTPTAGLADSTSVGRADRLRQAWGSIRERLGLRSPHEGSDPNRSSTPANPNDPREVVLAQMARAFNLGFGMSTESTNEAPPNTTDSSEENPDSPQLPPEGSFERFLVDLQVDLRATLTSQETSESTPTSEVPSVPHDSHRENMDNVSAADFSDVIPEFALNTEPDNGSSDSRPQDETSTQLVDLSPEDSLSSSHELQGDAATPAADAGDEASGLTDGVDAQGRINWWRLYRFPPISAPARGAGAASATTSPQATPIPPHSSGPTETSDMATEDPSDPLSEPIASARSNIVVPVIVVGLQSVSSSDWQDQEHEAELAQTSAESPDISRPRTTSDPTSPRENPNRRSRGWHSRAADAFRTLRSGGRRSRTSPTTSSPGSRTFLIYVIGGYYPPDHSIVTGGSNNLDSFEALLELADLLGQVKPPTATRDDIEKSGLEVITASQLDEYVSHNRVSSNCAERCLICLDEYIPEEDVRVMTCRHAFHRNCVDKWLETGRNNCPACRSKGVNVEA